MADVEVCFYTSRKGTDPDCVVSHKDVYPPDDIEYICEGVVRIEWYDAPTGELLQVAKLDIDTLEWDVTFEG